MIKLTQTLSLFCLSFSLWASEGGLPSTVIMRATSPSENLNSYKAGRIAVGKAMAGQKGKFHWKALVVFDVVSVVEELAEEPDATLRLALDWIKSEEDVRSLHVYYVGCLPKANFIDQDMWELFPKNKGIRVGGMKAEDVATIKQRQWLELELKGKIPSGDVSPANRYMVFRIESEPLKNPEGNGLVGLSPEMDKHTLTVGGEGADGATSTGGY